MLQGLGWGGEGGEVVERGVLVGVLEGGLYNRKIYRIISVTSQHITSHPIISHHLTSHPITSHHIPSQHITSHHVLLLITPHHIPSHPIPSHHTIPHHALSLITCRICAQHKHPLTTPPMVRPSCSANGMWKPRQEARHRRARVKMVT